MHSPPQTIYELRYNSALVGSAVRTWVRERLLGKQPGLWVAEACLLASAVFLFAIGSLQIASLFFAVSMLPVLLVAVGWGAHHIYKMRQLRAMGETIASLSVSEEALHFSSGAGKAKMPFASILDILERPAFWLLVTGVNHFTILPTKGIPAPLLDSLRTNFAALKQDS